MFDEYDDNYDVFEVDYKYEAFRDETGHITDFDSAQYHLYHSAVEQYKDMNPDCKLSVGVGYHSFQGGLYHHSYDALTEFWQLFDKLRKKA